MNMYIIFIKVSTKDMNVLKEHFNFLRRENIAYIININILKNQYKLFLIILKHFFIKPISLFC